MHLFRRSLLPDFKPVSEEKKRGFVRRNLRKFIISRKPIVDFIAKRTYKRVFLNTERLDAFGDASLRSSHFQQAKEVYERRHNWIGMAIAQMGLKDTEGAIQTLNQKHLFSKKAAARFLKRIRELDKGGKCAPHMSGEQTRIFEMLTPPPQKPAENQAKNRPDGKPSQENIKTKILKKTDTGVTQIKPPAPKRASIKAEEF
jgi:hypothetical protein